jgi:xylulokinase
LKGGHPLNSSPKTESNYFIGIDIGTTHIKSAVFDHHGNMLELQRAVTPLDTDRYGDIYQPIKIYELVRNQLLGWFKCYRTVRGISITGMAEAGLIVNRRTGSEASMIIPWFDKRTVALSAQIDVEKEITNFCMTGLRNSFKYGIYKYLWLLDHIDVKREDTIWLSVCDYILWKLTGEYITDPSFAARTYVYDIVKHCWDKQRLKAFGLTENNFPKVLPSGEKAGCLTDPFLLETIDSISIPICIGGHDHICAAYAVLQEGEDQICNSVGTAETYLGLAKEFRPNRELYQSGMVFGPFIKEKEYFWMGNISSSGQSVEWFRKKLQLEEISYDQMNAMLSETSEDPTNIIYLPFLSGIGTPLFDQEVSGALIGLRECHTAKHMLKAILEGIHYQGKWILSLVSEKVLLKQKEVICVGGATESEPWMQLKANILGIPVIVPKITEATLMGTVAVMIERNEGLENKRKFLYANQQDRKCYPVNELMNKQYHKIYKDQYTFLIDAIVKREPEKKV